MERYAGSKGLVNVVYCTSPESDYPALLEDSLKVRDSMCAFATSVHYCKHGEGTAFTQKLFAHQTNHNRVRTRLHTGKCTYESSPGGVRRLLLL